MRITCDVDPTTETIALTLEVPVTADPDRAADVAWAAVSRILTERHTDQGSARQPTVA